MPKQAVVELAKLSQSDTTGYVGLNAELLGVSVTALDADVKKARSTWRAQPRKQTAQIEFEQ